jgi:hypothetical protein
VATIVIPENPVNNEVTQLWTAAWWRDPYCETYVDEAETVIVKVKVNVKYRPREVVACVGAVVGLTTEV